MNIFEVFQLQKTLIFSEILPQNNCLHFTVYVLFSVNSFSNFCKLYSCLIFFHSEDSLEPKQSKNFKEREKFGQDKCS